MDYNQTEEKYKATKLWNDAIRAFRNQMPVKLHRKHFKSFADTFTGTEAVDWLHGYLSAKATASSTDSLAMTKRSQPVLGKVTREQTLALLNKFFDHGLFEPARAKVQEKSLGINWRVKDDGTLYRFSNISPSKIAHTPLALKNNSRANVNSVSADNSGNKTPTGKKALFISRPTLAVTPISYRKLPETETNGQPASETSNGDKTRADNDDKQFDKCSVIDDLLAMKNINGQTACDPKMEEKSTSTAFSSRQSSLRLKNEKIPFEQEKQNNFPQLQLVARQLSLEEVENVWKTVALSNLRQLLRLDVDDASFVRGQDICHNAKQFTARGVTRVFSKLDDVPRWTLQAMKCLANWPWKNSELNWPCYPGFERDVFATVLDFFATQPMPLVPYEQGELLLEVLVSVPSDVYVRVSKSNSITLFSSFDRVEYLDVQQWDASNDELMQSPPAPLVSAAEHCSKTDDDVSVETEFGARSPVTRLLLVEREPPRPTASIASVATKKQDEILSGLRSEFEANVRSLEEILSSLPGLVKSPRLLRELRDLRAKNGQQQDAKEGGSVQGFRMSPDRNLGSLNGHFDGRVLTGLLNLPGARFSVASTLTGSFDCSGSPPPISQSGYGTSLSFFTRAGRQTACKALQLCLLFLPPKNRRWLQLLLRMMSKICVNYCLRLDKRNAVSNRSLVLEAFCDLVVTGNGDGGPAAPGSIGTRQQRMKLLSFLLDSLNEVFAPPTELIANVETRIRQMQRAKICYNSSDQNTAGLTVNTNTDQQVTYCERISPYEYEQQATFSSRRALEKLLGSIADDKTLSGREKKRRLTKFKNSYPDLFYQRFPNAASFESLIKSSNNSFNKGCEGGARSGGPFGKFVSRRL